MRKSFRENELKARRGKYFDYKTRSVPFQKRDSTMLKLLKDEWQQHFDQLLLSWLSKLVRFVNVGLFESRGCPIKILINCFQLKF